METIVELHIIGISPPVYFCRPMLSLMASAADSIDVMIITLYKTTGSKIRYYTIHDRQGSLFHSYHFTAVWGLELTAGREKEYIFTSKKEMNGKMRYLVGKRLKSGYKVLYSFARENGLSVFLKELSMLQAV